MRDLLVLLLSATVIFVSASKPTTNDINQTLHNLGQSIKNDHLVKADEETRKLSDWWEYIRSHYKKSDQKKVEKYMDELDMSLAVGNQRQSEEEWKHLHEQWKKMNDNEK